MNLQLVYIYIVSAYSGLSGLELPLGVKENIQFIKSVEIKNTCEKQYYFATRKDIREDDYRNLFFDKNGRCHSPRKVRICMPL